MGAALVLTVGVAQAEEAPETPALTGNIGIVSNYLSRGISLTQGGPALQGGVDYNHPSGLYVSLWGSSVSNAAYNNSAGMELDVIAGVRQKWGDWDVEASLVTYNFPRAYVNGTDVSYNTQEIKLGVGRSGVNAAVSYALNNYWFGMYGTDALGNRLSTRGATYVELNWNPELSDGLVLNLHAGREWLPNMRSYNFSDFKVGVTKDLGSLGMPGWTTSLAAVHNTGDTSLWVFQDADGRAKRVVGTALQLTLNKSF